eukprot:COSAG03_NODE_1127_length_4765_cov_10.861552_2_plen_132_part_00
MGGGGGAVVYFRSAPPSSLSPLSLASVSAPPTGNGELEQLRSELAAARAAIKATERAQPSPASAVPPSPPCETSYGDAVQESYLPGCAGGGTACETQGTLELAQAACSTHPGCNGVTQVGQRRLSSLSLPD